MRCPFRKQIVREKVQEKQSNQTNNQNTDRIQAREQSNNEATAPALDDNTIIGISKSYIQQSIDQVLTDERILQMAQGYLQDLNPTALNQVNSNALRQNITAQIEEEINEEDMRNDGKRNRDDLSEGSLDNLDKEQKKTKTSAKTPSEASTSKNNPNEKPSKQPQGNSKQLNNNQKLIAPRKTQAKVSFSSKQPKNSIKFTHK